MNNKGQALVEFILIVPIFAFILLALIDVASIVSNTYKLENDLYVVVELYQNGEHEEITNYTKDKNIKVGYSTKDKYTEITVKRIVNIRTPILNNILGKQKEIVASKTIYNE